MEKESSPKNSMRISTNGKKEPGKAKECGGLLSRNRTWGLHYEDDDGGDNDDSVPRKGTRNLGQRLIVSCIWLVISSDMLLG
jgi:hypothetical protein